MLANNATLVVNSGNYFLGPVGTKPPTDLLNPNSPWENMGHTSIEDILALTSEGGEATVLGTLQAPNLRNSYSKRTETMRVVLQQFDVSGLRLFFGQNASTITDDARFLGVPATPQPTKAAFLAVYIDGANVFALYAPSVEILRGDDFEISDTESLAGLPLDIKPMFYVPSNQASANSWTWALTPLQAVPNATGATAGTPGSFTPNGSSVPNNIAMLSDVKATPTTKWTTGQYVTLGDGTQAHWNGTAWGAGKSA